MIVLSVIISTKAVDIRGVCINSKSQPGLCLRYFDCYDMRKIIFKAIWTWTPQDISYLKANECQPSNGTIQINKEDKYFCCTEDQWTEDVASIFYFDRNRKFLKSVTNEAKFNSLDR